MYVICRKCSSRIEMSHWPGTTSLSGEVDVSGNVDVGEGSISLGSGGQISFRSGGTLGLGSSRTTRLTCLSCKQTAEYSRSDAEE